MQKVDLTDFCNDKKTNTVNYRLVTRHYNQYRPPVGRILSSNTTK